jgi:hypothetical protein
MKKLTKKQIAEHAEKADLRARLYDIAMGAYGGFEMPEIEGDNAMGMASDIGLEAFGRWIGAIGNVLLDDSTLYLIKPNNLEYFDSIDKAVEHLYGSGVRARKS